MDLEQWKKQRAWKEDVDRLRDMIPGIFPGWTDYNLHDPGITLLELFAWLSQLQGYHLRQIGDMHRREYRKLLGAERVKRSPGHTYVGIKSPVSVNIPAGTRFYADHIPFETRQDQFATEGAFLRFVTGQSEASETLEGDWIKEGKGISLWPFGREAGTGSWMEIHLSRPLPRQGLHRLYLEFAKRQGTAGRPVDEKAYDGHGYYPLAEIRLEYLTEAGWMAVKQEAEAGAGAGEPGKGLRLWDSTYGFVQNGSIEFVLEDPMKEGDSRLRFTLMRSDYVSAPCISRISLAMVPVWQQETLRTEELPAFEGTGFPGQRFDMEEPEIWEEMFQLESENPESKEMEPWKLVEDFDRSGPEDRHYRLESGVLIFGDGVRGMAPEGRIQVTSLVRTLGREGNIKSNTIDRPGGQGKFRNGTDWVEIQISHEMDVTGGTAGESQEEALERFMGEQGGDFGAPGERAVTKEDYEKLVMDAPGLCVEACRCYSIHPDSNELVIAVKPGSDRERSGLNRGYEKNLYRYLEEKRMLGTKLRLVSPDYYNVAVACVVCAKTQYRMAASMVEDAVRTWVEGRGFGQGISYGELLGMIDALACVQEVQSLWLDGGSRGRQDSRGDILLPQNGLLHLKRVTCRLAAPMRERI